MSIAVIGAVFVDVKGFAHNTYSPTGTNIGSVNIVHGGVCRNVCENLAVQGESVTFVSMTEDSAVGRDVRERLSSRGANVTHLLSCPNGMGMWLAILTKSGELVGSISRQPDFAPLEAYIREHGESILSECDHVVLELGLNTAISETVLELAQRLEKPVYAVMGNMGVVLEHPEYLKRMQCFICNEIEAGLIFSRNLTNVKPDEMLQILKAETRVAGIRAMVITMGDKGSVYWDGTTGECGHCPAIPAVMVDSTGAGDAFFSATVMALCRGLSLGKAVAVGTRLASATIGCAESCCCKLEGLFEMEA